MMTLPQYITINGTNYASANLNDAARNQAANIQAVDAELARLQQQMAIAQTARNAYAAALIDAVKVKAGTEVVAEAKPKKPRVPRKPKAKAE